jgi:hypothetical protein
MAESDDDPPDWIDELGRQRASRLRGPSATPLGAPIGSAFVLPPGTLDRDRRLRAVLDVVDRLHGDGRLPSVRVDWRTLADQRAAEYVAFGPGSGLSDQVRIDPSRQRWAIATIHEIGHLLDLRGIGDPHVPASATEDRLGPWRNAVEVSDAFKMLNGLPCRSMAYYLRPEELWARSYAQWVANRSDDAELRRQIQDLRGANHSVPRITLNGTTRPSARSPRPSTNSFEG